MQTVRNDKTHDPLSHSAELTLGLLLETLWAHPQARLTFIKNGTPVRAGYHVTEVKNGQFSALDCGANIETWTEVFVQLLDVDASPEQMSARKFSSIIRKATEMTGLDADRRLTFEVSDGVQPMQIFRALPNASSSEEIVVDLSPRPASCKPQDRWQTGQPASCCGPKAA